MTKEVNIDIGGGKRAEYFSGLSRTNNDGLFIVLDPKRFRCSSVSIYPNLQLVRWVASEDSELPFADQTIDKAHLNFVSDYIAPVWGTNLAYKKLVSSLKRVMKPTGRAFIREPQGVIEIFAGLFEQESFRVCEPVRIRDENLTPQCTSFYEWAKKDSVKAERSIYLPMEFVATLPQSPQPGEGN